MNRLASLFLKIGALILIIVALLVSVLRLTLPHIDQYHTTVISQLQRITGLPINIERIEGRWQTFGPALTLQQINLKQDDIRFQAERVVLELDVWRSLWHWQLQFRDLTFYHLQLDIAQQQTQRNSQNLQLESIRDTLLHRINYFDLRNSRIAFFTPSGDAAELGITQLTWQNTKQRHQAEGLVNLTSAGRHYGGLQLIVDLQDQDKSKLSQGTFYVQADEIDMRPWLTQWVTDNTGLAGADFSLAAWIHIKDSWPDSADLLLKQGSMRWGAPGAMHQLDITDQLIHAQLENSGWLVNTTLNHFATDGELWPQAQLSALWLPEINTDDQNNTRSAQLRIRATQLQLERLKSLLPIFSFIEPEKLAPWLKLDPTGNLNALAIDIPLQTPEKSRFIAEWQDISWPVWQKLPGVNHFSGRAEGDINAGRIRVDLQQSLLPYDEVFKAPLEIEQANGELYWQNNQQGLRLWSEDVNLKAKSLWVNGAVSFTRTTDNQSWLNILAGIRLDDAREAWRYFPQPLMGEHLVNYLTGAIQGGHASDATLLYSGQLKDFPYKNNQGIFEVLVPLRQATFQFQPGWQPFSELDIDLDFVNDGLLMTAENGRLGKVSSSNIIGRIPAFGEKKLFINAEVKGTGTDIHDYLNDSPLKDSVGAALDQVQISGDVSGRLHLEIPLKKSEGQKVVAQGHVNLLGSQINLAALNSQLTAVTGSFDFDSGELTSQPIQANWFGQPISLTFNSGQTAKGYQVDVDLAGQWQLNKLPGVPTKIADDLAANANWRTKVKIELPAKQSPKYQVVVDGTISKVSERFASMFELTRPTIPVQVRVNGGLKQMIVEGTINQQQQFNTEWQLGQGQLHLSRGIWLTGEHKDAQLPEAEKLIVRLPNILINGEYWLAALRGNQAASPVAISASTKVANLSSNLLPKQVVVNVPALSLAGQTWNNLVIQVAQSQIKTDIQINGKQLKAKAQLSAEQPWSANIDYLYYNPQWPASAEAKHTEVTNNRSTPIDFSSWPAVSLTCQQCWLFGQNFGQIMAELEPQKHHLLLKNGSISTANSRLTLQGRWGYQGNEAISSISGKLESDRIDHTLRHFGLISPLQVAPMTSEFDVNWLGEPWKPQLNTLAGRFSVQLGKGEIVNMSGGRVRQILRLLSFNALLRKLRLDFSDTFSESLYFDGIHMDADIVRGVITTNNLLIDSLSVGIAMKGSVDLVERQINMQAIVTPQISTTVGVATAFAVNPVVGAAVFAASQVLTPLWQRMSFIRYQITGSLDRPSVDEVFGNPLEESSLEPFSKSSLNKPQASHQQGNND